MTTIRLARLGVNRNKHKNDERADDGGSKKEAKQKTVNYYCQLSPLGRDITLTLGRLHPFHDRPQLAQYFSRQCQSSCAGTTTCSVLRTRRVREVVDVVAGRGRQHVAAARPSVCRRQRDVVGKVEAETDAGLTSKLKLATTSYMMHGT